MYNDFYWFAYLNIDCVEMASKNIYSKLCNNLTGQEQTTTGSQDFRENPTCPPFKTCPESGGGQETSLQIHHTTCSTFSPLVGTTEWPHSTYLTYLLGSNGQCDATCLYLPCTFSCLNEFSNMISWNGIISCRFHALISIVHVFHAVQNRHKQHKGG